MISQNIDFYGVSPVAERVGFEPTERINVHTISRSMVSFQEGFQYFLIVAVSNYFSHSCLLLFSDTFNSFTSALSNLPSIRCRINISRFSLLMKSLLVDGELRPDKFTIKVSDCHIPLV